MVKINYERDGDYVDRLIDTGNEPNNPARESPWAVYRMLNITLEDQQIKGDDTETETVTIEVVSGLEVARGKDLTDATVLAYDGDVTVSVGDTVTTKTLTNGSVSFDVTTTKTAGSEIEVVAESLANHPAESDTATIEVTSQ